jgi:hypothetical protein
VLEVLGEGLHQLGVLALVVAGQGAEPLLHEGLHVGQVIDRCQHPEHVEVGEDRGALRRRRRLLQAQRQPGLTQRPGSWDGRG